MSKQKKVFSFFIDQEFIGYNRGYFQIEAENEQEAQKLAIEAFKNDDASDLVDAGQGWDTIDYAKETGTYELYICKNADDVRIASSIDDEFRDYTQQ